MGKVKIVPPKIADLKRGLTAEQSFKKAGYPDYKRKAEDFNKLMNDARIAVANLATTLKNKTSAVVSERSPYVIDKYKIDLSEERFRMFLFKKYSDEDLDKIFEWNHDELASDYLRYAKSIKIQSDRVSGIEPLSKEEIKLVQPLINGLTIKKAAASIFISLSTANRILKSLNARYNCKSKGALLKFILSNNLL